MTKEANSANQYASDYLADYGFEVEMVRARQKLLVEYLQAKRPKTVVEIGCGNESLACVVPDFDFAKWIIVEPAEAFAAQAQLRLANQSQVAIVNAYAESAI